MLTTGITIFSAVRLKTQYHDSIKKVANAIKEGISMAESIAFAHEMGQTK
jgi:hypothetical protein